MISNSYGEAVLKSRFKRGPPPPLPPYPWWLISVGAVGSLLSFLGSLFTAYCLYTTTSYYYLAGGSISIIVADILLAIYFIIASYYEDEKDSGEYEKIPDWLVILIFLMMITVIPSSLYIGIGIILSLPYFHLVIASLVLIAGNVIAMLAAFRAFQYTEE
jgi:hypothetical protein